MCRVCVSCVACLTCAHTTLRYECRSVSFLSALSVWAQTENKLNIVNPSADRPARACRRPPPSARGHSDIHTSIGYPY